MTATILQPIDRHPATPSRDLSACGAVWHVGGSDMPLRIPVLLALRERGLRVGAVGVGSGEAFAACGIPYWRYSLSGRLSPLADARALSKLQRLFEAHAPEVVHAFSTKPAILAMLAARKAGIAVRVRTVNGRGYVFSSASPLARSLRPIYRRLQRRASAAAGVTIFQNSDDRAYFRTAGLVEPDGDALVHGSGIDVEQWQRRRPAPAELDRLRGKLNVGRRPVVTMISRLMRPKGVLEFLQAARLVRRFHPEARFLLVGPPSPRGRLGVAPAEIARFADDVLHLGERSDVPALLAISSIFVLPSYYCEGIPRVLLEAAASGLPLVTTDMPGCRDVVRHGVNGLLIPPRSSGALAAALLELLDSAPLRMQLGEAGPRQIERFSLKRVVDSYAAIYSGQQSAVSFFSG